MNMNMTTSQTPFADQDELSPYSSDFMLILGDLAGLDGAAARRGGKSVRPGTRLTVDRKRSVVGKGQCNKFLAGMQRIRGQVELMQRTQTHHYC